jgi:8-oxo-dGTP pyrophosphatase MutT (NUDIX family)
MLRNGIGSKHPGKRWILPGGQVDPGERSVDSMLRELKEETGISLKEKDVRMFFHAFDPTYQNEMVFYKTEVAVKNPSMKEPEKFDMAIWYPLKDIDQLDGLHAAKSGMFMKEAVQRLRSSW